MALGNSDEEYQEYILPHVSRTFALTIPQLPPPLRSVVTSAYLLCRIADTIEDEPALSTEQTLAFLQRLKAVVHGAQPAGPLAQDLAVLLSEATLPQERALVRNLERVIALTARLGERQRAAIRRCVDLMCDGMHRFQRTASLRGLARARDLDDYCYCVAGVVGEMLTELFCDYSPGTARQHAALYELARSFAQGLQMTNILKDVWEDRRRGACWLPQEVFDRHGVDLAQVSPELQDPRFAAGFRELIGLAHFHLRNALAFTLLVPKEEAGIRRFCLWAIGLAVLTLRSIDRHPGFTAGAQVKVSRRTVTLTCLTTSWAARHDRVLRWLFERAARGLPLQSPAPADGPALTAGELLALPAREPEAHSASAPLEKLARTGGRSCSM